MPEPDLGRDLLAHIAGPADFQAAFAVTDAGLQRLETYAATLALWQQRINLVAPSTLPDLWHRHFADSAQLLALAPASPQTWLDLGSGAGFPGLVVAILLADRPEPRPRFVLVESDQRKCAFLAEVVRRTGLAASIPVDILCARIEDPATRAKLPCADVVSARALASLERLLQLAHPWLGPSTVAIFPKGRSAESEVTEARRCFRFASRLMPSRTEAGASIVVVDGPAAFKEG